MTATCPSTAITMSSLEMVDYINSMRQPGEAELRHADLLAKVPLVLGGVERNFSSYYIASNGKRNPLFNFPKREACLMAMSYSYDLQAKVFDRMTALEALIAAPAPTAYIPANYADALRLAASQQDELNAAHIQIAADAPIVAVSLAVVRRGGPTEKP